MVICIVVTGSCLAQEEKIIQGKNNSEEKEQNSILEISKKREKMETVIAVYPNPSAGQLFIEGNSGSTVTVYSTEGIYVGSWVIGDALKVEITDLPSGTFLCVIQNGDLKTVKRIVVL